MSIVVSTTSTLQVKPAICPVMPGGIPSELQRERRWVCWQLRFQPGRSKPWTKIPIVPSAPGREASSTDPNTWGTFEQALTTYLSTYRVGSCDGIGFMLGGDWFGFDVDGCRDPETGRVDPEALSHVRLLNTYVEVSPSKTGLHAIGRGRKPGPSCRKGRYELYDDKRYFTVTGYHVDSFPTSVQECSAGLRALYRQLFETDSDNMNADVSADVLLARAMRNPEFASLWGGDASGYPSHSEADAALCLLLARATRRDAARVDCLFRRSGLYREKWDRDDYRRRTIEHAIILANDSDDDGKRSKRVSTRTELVRLIEGNGTELFHGPDGHPFATVPVGDHRETVSLLGSAFLDYLSGLHYQVKQRAVGSTDLKDAVRTLAGTAKHGCPEHRVFVRLARVEDAIWHDLGRPDWGAIKITRAGWSYELTPDVKFRRPKGIQSLPSPIRASHPLDVLLKRHLNVDNATLPTAWLIGALRGLKPFPMLAIMGEHGTAKTTAQRRLRRIIDPNVADLRLPPKEPRDLMIAALNSYIVAFDNLSVIPDWLSDALCTLSTGGGFSTRELFSDLDETLFSAERPILLNGIANVVTRPDLLDRSLVVTLEPIPEDKRRSETVLEAAFAADHPEILGALYDAVATALANESTTTLDRLPRMADFATWVTAASSALGWETDTFIEAYRENQNDAIESVMEGDVIVDTIKDLAPWQGQLKDLLDRIPDHEYKPKHARGLRAALTRKAPALRHLGIKLTFTKGHVHTLTITRDESLLTPSDAQRRDDVDVPF